MTVRSVRSALYILVYKSIMYHFYLSLLGPFGERDDQQVFIQKLVPDTDHVIVRFSSTGKR